MMPEISLNILDITENSIRADASLISIDIRIDTDADRMRIIIGDNGCGMSPELVARVTDPFCTTRTTRKVGLGIPFYKMAAEATGGTFSIESEVGKGTSVRAEFVLSHIDRMPLGDISCTIHTLVVFHPNIDFVYTYRFNDRAFTMDTRTFRQILGDVPFDEPEVSDFIMKYLAEHKLETDGGAVI